MTVGAIHTLVATHSCHTLTLGVTHVQLPHTHTWGNTRHTLTLGATHSCHTLTLGATHVQLPHTHTGGNAQLPYTHTGGNTCHTLTLGATHSCHTLILGATQLTLGATRVLSSIANRRPMGFLSIPRYPIYPDILGTS